MERPDQPAAFTPRAGLPAVSDQLPDPAQQSLVSALRSSFAVLRLVLIVLVVLYLTSGVFRIQPGEQGIIVRLGRLLNNRETDTPVFTPGWIWWALPDPFDEKIRLAGGIRTLEIDTFLFRRLPQDVENRTDIATIRPVSSTLTPGVDGAMLSGDKNLSHGLWEVEYRVADAARFVTRVGDNPAALEPLLRRLFETAILREVAHRKVEEVTRTKIDIIAERVARRLQGELDRLGAGVEVVKVNSKTIVPAQVAPAFVEVTKAENERKEQEDAARQKATEILNQAAGPQHRDLLERIQEYGAGQLAGADAARLEQLRAAIDTTLAEAQGDVAARLREAQAWGDKVREDIRREYEEFLYWLPQYRQYPGPTRLNLWTQMRAAVLGSADNELFWVPDADTIEVWVNRDPNRALEAEEARLRRRSEKPR